MKAEQEHQQRKDSQQTMPESSETSGEGPSTSVLKVKSKKGKTVNIMQVEVDEPAEKKSCETSPEVRDKSERINQLSKRRLKLRVTLHPLNEDQMYELMQEEEMTTEYQEMTSEQEEELVLQLMPRERVEYWEMKEYY